MNDAVLAPEVPDFPEEKAPTWRRLLAKSLIRAEELLDSEDDRISGAMAQSLLAIAARTGVWKPGAADDSGPSGPQITLTLEQTRLVAQGNPKALAELERLVKAREKIGTAVVSGVLTDGS